MSKIVVWGAGERTDTCFARSLWGDNDILAIVDTEPCADKKHGYPVITPNEIAGLGEYDYLIINNQFYYEIIPKACEMQIPISKIIITDHAVDEPFITCFDRGKTVIPQIYEMNKLVLKRIVKTNERDLLDDTSIFSDSRYHYYEYKSDYYRYRTFEFVAEQMKEEGVQGELAEFGVFRGLFSSVISSKFPEKKIYLFDTFEGFESEEGRKELSAGNCSDTFLESHKDTSVDRVLANLPYPENAIVCKGLFPESIPQNAENEKYAFVSLDVDFEESTLAGLRFFYPRMTAGGYMFIHDYNTQYLKGVRNAVNRYEKEIGCNLKKIPIADRAGTLVVIK